MSLNEFAQEVHALAVEKGFYDPEPSVAKIFAAIHSDIGRAFDEWCAEMPMVYFDSLDDGHCRDISVLLNPEPKGSAVRLIDVVLRVLDEAAAWNLSLQVHHFGRVCYPGMKRKREVFVADIPYPDLITILHQMAVCIYTLRVSNDPGYNNLGKIMSGMVSLVRQWLKEVKGIDPDLLLRERYEYLKAAHFTTSKEV